MAVEMRGVVSLVLLAVAVACARRPGDPPAMPCPPVRDPGRLESLSEARILFGHQSVGQDLLEAMEALVPPGAPPVIRKWSPGEPCPEPGLWHFRVGRNGDPVGKIEAFRKVVAGEACGAGAAWGFKFCFADFDEVRDVQGLFDRYRAVVDEIRERRPGIVVFHCTVPLTVDDSLPRRMVKHVLGRVTARELNRRRERFNDLLRRAYGAERLLFDLAALEAGERLRPGEAGAVGGKGRALRPRWTEDGAHPSGEGARVLGCAFLEFLVERVGPAVAAGSGR